MSHTAPAYSVNPNQVTFYSENLESNFSNYTNQNSLKNLEMNQGDGELSIKGSKRVKAAVNWMLYLIKNQIQEVDPSKPKVKLIPVFVTLSMASDLDVEDKVIKKLLLNQFLIELRQNHGVEHYVWKAEKGYNGRIHFHILIDRHIDQKVIRDMWNRIQNKLGFVDSYSNFMRELTKQEYFLVRSNEKGMTRKKSDKVYNRQSKIKWSNPNSTDIKRVHKVRDLGAYISKYVGKQKGTALIEGRIWGSSQTVSKLKNLSGYCVGDVEDYFIKVLNQFNLYSFHTDYSHTYFFSKKFINSALYSGLDQMLKGYVTERVYKPLNAD
ncbi:MAG: hypothetical protein ACI9YB_003056 [Halioglobus sp.]|jgi:hypothetical protein